MSVAGRLARLYALRRLARLREHAADPGPAQARVLRRLVGAARETAFGREHGFASIRDAAELRRRVPLRGYAEFAPWWERARRGERSVTWPGAIGHFALSSGTTSGEKYLPVSDDTIRSSARGAFDSIVPALARREHDLLGGKLLFLGGSVTLRREGPVLVGDNTGIMALHIPRLARRFHSPGREIAAETDWERKIERTAALALRQDIRMLSGVPSWLVLLAERILELARASTLREIWPRLTLVVHGGMSFAPYRARMEELSGPGVSFLDTYSASEGGMLAVQDRFDEPGMLPIADGGVFFELVPVGELGSERPVRLGLEEAEADVDYAVALTTDSGIWAYLVGDAIRFLSVRPLRLLFSGRLAQTLNAFGEHVSGGELDRAVVGGAAALGARVREYAVAPEFPNAARRAGRHVYYIEFDGAACDRDALAREIDRILKSGNEDYAAHRAGSFGLEDPQVCYAPAGSFYAWMRARGKLGGQNKIPRVLDAKTQGSFRPFLREAPEPSNCL